MPFLACVELLSPPEQGFSNLTSEAIISLPGSEVQFSLTSPAVPLMGANRELREVALAVYRATGLKVLRLKPGKKGDPKHRGRVSELETAVFMDFETDKLLFGPLGRGRAMRRLSANMNLRQLKHLALTLVLYLTWDDLFEIFDEVLEAAPNLKSLEIILGASHFPVDEYDTEFKVVEIDSNFTRLINDIAPGPDSTGAIYGALLCVRSAPWITKCFQYRIGGEGGGAAGAHENLKFRVGVQARRKKNSEGTGLLFMRYLQSRDVFRRVFPKNWYGRRWLLEKTLKLGMG